jgi:hypothetical protein
MQLSYVKEKDKMIRSQYKASGWKKVQLGNGNNMEKDVSPRVYEDEHEQVNMSMTKSFLEYFVHVHKIIGKYFVTHTIIFLLTGRNILPRVHG